MIDFLIYLFLAAGMAWVGWDDRTRPFDYEHGTPLAQEGTAHDSQH